ncbi:hypothetical protein GCM10011487_59670 [Steroidobacter agaridevorans]|uniref:Uncharacterized protein n=1 Tax=Steroidobacter agaridevorans TaxID=2695856 RepID=A0A829YKS6_9GAMM|nr:hypothetical protein GCM10011487_59670 [Steroidobacter agaridevorans]
MALAGGAELIEVLGGHVLAKDFRGFGSLTLGGVHGGLGDFHIDDLGFDEPTAFERIHCWQPLITEQQLVGCSDYKSEKS